MDQQRLIEHLKKLYEAAAELRQHLIELGVAESSLPPQNPPTTPPGSGNA